MNNSILPPNSKPKSKRSQDDRLFSRLTVLSVVSFGVCIFAYVQPSFLGAAADIVWWISFILGLVFVLASGFFHENYGTWFPDGENVPQSLKQARYEKSSAETSNSDDGESSSGANS